MARLPTVGADFEQTMYSVVLDAKLCSSIRDATTARATELSAVLQDVASAGGHESFELHYLPNPLEAAIARWVSAGGEAWQVCVGCQPRLVCASKVYVRQHVTTHGSLSNRLMAFILTKAPTHL